MKTDVDAAPVQPIVHQPYYEQDGIVLYHGDSYELLPLMPKVDLVITDRRMV